MTLVGHAWSICHFYPLGGSGTVVSPRWGAVPPILGGVVGTRGRVAGAAVGAMVIGGFLVSTGVARATQGGGGGGPTAEAPSRDYEQGVLLVGFRSGTGDARKSKAEAHHGSAADERIPSINVDRVRLA